jgi:hypothetical protein
VLRLLGDDVVLQRIGRGEVVRGMHQGKIERIEEEGEALAHRLLRNWPGTSAVWQNLDCWLMAPEKSWCLVECLARWEPQEEGVMNTAVRFSLS